MIENQMHERFLKPSDQDGQPSYRQENDAVLHVMQQDINEMKEQIAQITELLYVYDRALQHLWESQ